MLETSTQPVAICISLIAHCFIKKHQIRHLQVQKGPGKDCGSRWRFNLLHIRGLIPVQWQQSDIGWIIKDLLVSREVAYLSEIRPIIERS